MNREFMRAIGCSTRWKPGESGNPKGRPKRSRALTEAMREVLDGDTLLGMRTDEIYRQIGKRASAEDDPSVARLLIECAIAHFIAKGNPGILASIFERIDGPPKTPGPDPVEPITCDDDAIDIFDAINLVRERRSRTMSEQ